MYFILFYKAAQPGSNPLYGESPSTLHSEKEKPTDPRGIHKLVNYSEGQTQQVRWVLKKKVQSEGCFIKWSYLAGGRPNSDWPQREEDAVSHQDAHHPDDGEAEADVAEILVGSGEEVPRGQLLGGEALRHLVVHDALQALLAEVEGVAQRKLPRRQRLGAAQLLHFLLHWSPGPLDNAWACGRLTVRPARWLALSFNLRVRFGFFFARKKDHMKNNWVKQTVPASLFKVCLNVYTLIMHHI